MEKNNKKEKKTTNQGYGLGITLIEKIIVKNKEKK